MSTEASIQKGKGLVSNPEFFITFSLSIIFGILGAGVVFTSWLDYDEAGAFEGVRLWAIGLITIVAALFAVAWFSGLGEKLFVLVVAVFGLLGGILSVITVSYLWAMPEADGGHGAPLYAALLALVIIVLPIASIAGERILPLFVGFIAAIWGVLSVIIFVMVVFIGVEE